MDECIVHVKEGKLKGKVCIDYDGYDYYSFQGIPYAKPPLGDLRFKAPVPVEPWKGIKDATKEGNISLQIDDATGKITGSEDCLYLNIYTPQISQSTNGKLKPILFWIHGGTFLTGSGNTDFFGPDYFMPEDIILITTNYRLGYLGFLSLEDPDLNVPGNAGLKDVVLALNWVQNNIEPFCGDPNNVTIAGSSSGAAIVHYLMLSPMAKGLFHRAIMQSGSALNTWALTKSNRKRIFNELGYEFHDEKEMLRILQSVSTTSLLKVQQKCADYFYAHKMRSIGPVIEKNSKEQAFLSEHPIDILKSGKYNKVPFITGYNSQEGLISEVIYGKEKPNYETYDNFERKIPYYFNIPRNTDFSKTIAEKIRKYYYENGKGKTNTDIYFTMQTNLLVMLGLYYNIKLSIENLQCPIYFYKLSAETKVNVVKQLIGMKHPGACHGDELGYLFKNIFSPPMIKGSTEETCVRKMVKLWSNFVRTGNPNETKGASLIDVNWEPIQTGKYNCLNIDKKFTAALNLDMEKMEIWKEISAMNRYESKF